MQRHVADDDDDQTSVRRCSLTFAGRVAAGASEPVIMMMQGEREEQRKGAECRPASFPLGDRSLLRLLHPKLGLCSDGRHSRRATAVASETMSESRSRDCV